jgi:cardiolipin synthase
MSVDYVPGNQVRLLENGVQFFPALIAEIAAARSEIHLETYIFQDDTTGRQVVDALCRAASRGVKVRVLMDGFGSKDLPDSVVTQLRHAGIDVLVFRPERIGFWLRHQHLRRLHRKIALIDAHIAFVGGINIIDDFDMPGQTPPRFDYAVRVQGPVLDEVVPVVHRLWRLVKWTQARRRGRSGRGLAADPRPAGTQRAAFLVRDNLRHRRDIEQAYLDAIAAARDEIFIANAYFLPGIRFRRALVDAAQRGVRVTLLLQGRVEYRLLHYATRALYGQLLGAGVSICEYHSSFLHAKVAVIDTQWSTVGSSNIDPFSLLLAREANILVDDTAFATQLRNSLQAAIDAGGHCLPTHGNAYSSWWTRVLAWLAYASVRFMMGMLGYAKHR